MQPTRSLPPGKRRFRGFLPGALALLLAATAGCGRSEPEKKAGEKKTTSEGEVSVASPRREDIRSTLSRPGFVEAFEQTAMFAKLAGYVEKVNADIGDEVKEGEPLAVLYVPEMEVDLRQKDALVQKAQADLKSARAKVKSVEAGVQRARAEVKRWDMEQRRQERMARDGTLDRQSLDVVVATLETAQARLAEALADVTKARSDEEVAAKNLLVAKANKDYAAAILEYARVKAPYQGVVVKRRVNTGDFVQPAAGSGGMGEPLYLLARTDKGVRIFLDVPESASAAVTEKTRALIRPVQAAPGLEVEGHVTRSAWALDPGSRTLRTEIDIPKPGKLRPGMFAEVSLTTEHHGVWTVPASAVVAKDNEVYAFRVEKGRAVKTPLRVGLNNGKRAEVVKVQRKAAEKGEKGVWEDLTGSERFIVTNPDKLEDGRKVTVAKPRAKGGEKESGGKTR